VRYQWGWDPGASRCSEGSIFGSRQDEGTPCTAVDGDELRGRDKSGDGLDNGSPHGQVWFKEGQWTTGKLVVAMTWSGVDERQQSMVATSRRKTVARDGAPPSAVNGGSSLETVGNIKEETMQLWACSDGGEMLVRWWLMASTMVQCRLQWCEQQWNSEWDKEEEKWGRGSPTVPTSGIRWRRMWVGDARQSSATERMMVARSCPRPRSV
jgi:hypothetical protein